MRNGICLYIPPLAARAAVCVAAAAAAAVVVSQAPTAWRYIRIARM